VTYEKVLTEVEQADEVAKKTIRGPRSYEESDKKLKTVKIVTKKGDVAIEENKKKKPKQMATTSITTVQEEEQVENIEATKEPSADQEDNESIPLEEVQQPTMSIPEKLQASGRKPAPFSKTAAKYKKDSIIFSLIHFSDFLAKLHRSRKKVNQKKFKLHQMQVNPIQRDLIITL
jgi:hypothetical protein